MTLWALHEENSSFSAFGYQPLRKGQLGTNRRGATPKRGGVRNVQYATMVDLLQEAEQAGEAQTAFVNERLADAFDIWLSEQDLREITEEEEDALRRAFEKGFGICVHDAS
jgi:hypothetical protein